MIRPTTLSWAVMALLMGCALFLMKYKVQTLEEQLASINRSIQQDQRAIHVLKAEWSFLNDPSRLNSLSVSLLGMRPTSPKDVVFAKDIPYRPATEKFQDITPLSSEQVLTQNRPGRSPSEGRGP